MAQSRKAIWLFNERVDYLQQRIDALQADAAFAVLEAGCGSCSHFRFSPSAQITGIDISREQLERNMAIHEKICADVQTHHFDDASFNVIICWNVMEHLSDPHVVLEKFFRWLKPGGIIIVGTPNIFSGKGLITKLTPHFVHVPLYKYVLGKKDAGQPGTEPFPTYLRMALAPRNLERFAAAHDITVDTATTYRTPWEDNIRNPLTRAVWALYKALLKVVSLGALDVHNSELLVVLQRPATAP